MTLAAIYVRVSTAQNKSEMKNTLVGFGVVESTDRIPFGGVRS